MTIRDDQVYVDERQTTWTREALEAEALKYSSRREFKAENSKAYHMAYYYKIMPEICTHMQKQHRCWSDEDLQDEALKYQSKRGFRAGSPSAYITATNRGLFKTITQHFIGERTYWRDSDLLNLTNEYEWVKDFREDHATCYDLIIRRGLSHNMKRSERGFKYDEPALLYYLKVNGGEAFKIGITQRLISQRYSAVDMSKIEVIFTLEYAVGMDAFREEQRILKEFKDLLYDGPPLLENGNTELFKKDIYAKIK